MLDPCSPCICGLCEQCMFGYRPREKNHENMKRLIERAEQGHKLSVYDTTLIETYKRYHPDWKEEMNS